MIIGLTGRKRSGKNTAAMFIKDNFAKEYRVYEHSFASKLKQSAVAAITGRVLVPKIAEKFCDDLKEDSYFSFDIWHNGKLHNSFNFTGREYLQWYGTEAHREIFGQDFWTDIVLNEIYARSDGSIWEENLDVITDVRFPDEAHAIKYMGGKIIRVNRPGREQEDSHISEQGLPDELIDLELWNDSGFEDLEFRTISIIKEAIERMYVSN